MEPGLGAGRGCRSHPGGSTAAALGHAVILHRTPQLDRLWNHIQDLDDKVLATHIPVEAVDAALAAGTESARERAAAIAAANGELAASVLVDLAGRFLAFGDRDRAAGLLAELRGRATVALDERRLRSWTLIEGWLEPPPVVIPAGAVPFGVLQYRTPDPVLTSGNIGDPIQTLALLGTWPGTPG